MKTKKIFAFACALALLIPGMIVGETNVSNDNLVLLPVPNDPTISFRIWFKAGSQNDPKGKEGLAEIVASMLTEAATTKNSYEQILEKLYPLAASYSNTMNAELTVITGRTHKDNLRDYYPLLIDAILAPAFKQEDLDRLKSQALNYLENTLRYSSDEELGKAVLYNDVFAGTPYGHITTGTIEAVKSITLEDVRGFYRKYYTRDNLVIGVGGGYEPALIEQLKTDLNQLPAGSVAEVPKPQPNPISGFQVFMVEKDAPATAISMGYPMNILRGTKDWYALAIANSWLGEHRNSSSHLYQVIREERGLNYGDYSYIEHYPGGGQRQLPPQNVGRRVQLFEIWIRPVPNETRHFSLRAALREYRNLVENGMTQGDFDLTRNFLKKYVLNYAQTTMERLGYALDDKYYGIKGSHLDMFREMMDKLTVGEVNEAIKRHWQYGNMQIAIITKDAEAFKKALVEDSPSPITYATPKSDHVMKEDVEIVKFPVKVMPEHIRILPVTDLLVK
ncbi:MAG: pitrilysin family protein [Bacteroidota bacterium]